MDMSNRSTTTTDRFDDLTTWIDTLEDLGVDTRTGLAPEYEQLARVQQITQHKYAYKSDESTPNRAAEIVATTDLGNYESVIAVANSAAFAANAEQRAQVLDIFDRAIDLAEESACRIFRSRGDAALELIRPAHESISARIIELWAAIPDGVTGLEEAARAKVHAEWLELEELTTRWNNMAPLIASWFVNRVIKTDGKKSAADYKPLMFMVADYQAYADASVGRGQISKAGAGLTAAGAQLKTIAEVDEVAIESETTTPAALRQQQHQAFLKQQEARKELAAKYPKRHRLNQDGSKQPA